jgi:hypothetical protein
MNKLEYQDRQLAKKQTLQALQIFKSAIAGVSFEEKRQQAKLQIFRNKIAAIFRLV